ncbi:helix-turn-helix domain-containing protein [Methylosinus sp. PW1]|uniref:helix-turn-helix domain-containing protein n=1 Tax=Methylosinus sp. PW1 TaxID=107636 RepID=UPI0012EC9D4C|nr:helix-turn-helix domain-containing protein [Methylosinus sp. PW1]
MTDAKTDDTIAALREALRRRSIKLTTLAEKIEVPYRSLQNYLNKNDMPLWVYEKICRYASIDPTYPINNGRSLINRNAIAGALIDVFGQELPSLSNDSDSLSVISAPAKDRSKADLRRDASAFAVLLSGHYDLNIERELSEPIDESKD